MLTSGNSVRTSYRSKFRDADPAGAEKQDRWEWKVQTPTTRAVANTCGI